MPYQLTAEFEKQFRGGPLIQSRFEVFDTENRIVALFGPSGGGKTTILRCLAGLERPSRGAIQYQGTTWYESTSRFMLLPQFREIAYLPQDYALFPHLTVVENIRYSLRALSFNKRAERVAEMVAWLRLQGLEQRYPHEISGGQQQRVALARALARRPKLLLLDEPLSALDSVIREELRGELRKLLRESAVPTLIVSHDRAEVSALADQVLIVDQGAVRQQGTVDDVFLRPASRDVARVVGVENILEGTLVTDTAKGPGVFFRANGASLASRAAVGPKRTPELFILQCNPLHSVSGTVAACIRAENVSVRRSDEVAPDSANAFAGLVVAMSPQGALVRMSLDCGLLITAIATRAHCDALELAVDQPVIVSIEPAAVHVISLR